MIGSFKYGWFSLKTAAPTSLLYTKATQLAIVIGSFFSDAAGSRVAINSDGKKIAVAAPVYNSYGGAVYFYNNTSSSIYTISGSILGTNGSNNYYGNYDLLLDETGLKSLMSYGMIASNSGIKRFDWNGTAWNLKGTLNLNTVTSIRCDKTASVITYSNSVSGAANQGYAKIIEWDGVSTPIQRGPTFYGTDSNQQLGSGIAISKDGNTVAISSPYISTTTTNLGSVSTFKWDGINLIKTGTLWASSYGQLFGRSVALNEDGTIMAVASVNENAPNLSKGVVRVYEWSSDNWLQKGSDIYSKTTTADAWGVHLDMNWAGNIIAVGDSSDDTNALTDNGSVQIIQWGGSDWVNIIPVLSGAVSADYFGPLSLNKVGDRLVVGVRGYDSGGVNQRGAARIFQLTT